MRPSGFFPPVALLVAAVVAIVAAVTAVLRLPGIPYNVGELFLDHGSLPALVFFALALLWIGAGAMLLAHVTLWSRWPYLVLPLALIVVSLMSKMLISRGVTYESLDDIIGANTVFTAVAGQGAWGETWKHFLSGLGPNVVDFVERRVRYTALYSIPLLGLALAFLQTARTPSALQRTKPLDACLTVVCAAAWFWLARTVVISWAATDNLTELIAQRPVLGIAGEWYLSAIPILVGVSVAQLLRATSRPEWWPAAVVSTIAALPIGWLLLNLGLEPRVEKYGYLFSGAQFLLGPDRSSALSAPSLFARWAAVELGGIAVTFAGAWIAHRLATGGVGGAATFRNPSVADEVS